MIDRKQAEEIITEVREKLVQIGQPMDTHESYTNHILGAAKVAEFLAPRLGFDEERAYVCALLHDVEKAAEKTTGRFHGNLGYERFEKEDPEVARTCLIHSFPGNILDPLEETIKTIPQLANEQDFFQIKTFIETHEASDFDFLMQVADISVDARGLVTIEARFADWERRHNRVAEAARIERNNKLKRYFEKKLNVDNLYDLLREVDFLKSDGFQN